MPKYKRTYTPNGTKSTHRYVWEQHNGKIPKGYYIHHKDGDSFNNKIENLELISPEEHRYIHAGYKKINNIWYKKCSRCEVWKAIDEYYWINKTRIQTLCKKCKSIVVMDERQKNPEKYKKYRHEYDLHYYKKNREKILKYKHEKWVREHPKGNAAQQTQDK